MPFSTSWRRVGLAALLFAAAFSLLAASACGATSAGRGAASSSTAEGTGGVTEPGDGGEVFFPHHQGSTPLVGNGGRLVEDEAGCIRFRISEGDSTTEGTTPTLLWPRPWSAERGEDGRVRIFDEEGRTLARVGDEVWLGMAFVLPTANPLEEVSEVDERTKRELLRRCPGWYYITGSEIGPPLPRRGETTSS